MKVPSLARHVELSPAADEFVLLQDLPHAYARFELRRSDVEVLVRSKIAPAMIDVVRRHTESLQVHPFEEIRHMTALACPSSSFVVTMDGGSYFQRFDYAIDITRAAYRLEDVSAGPYFRIPRENQSQLVEQVLLLQAKYEKFGDRRPIILCDDGIGTGRSLETLIDIMSDVSLSVNAIKVLLNPQGLGSIRAVGVEALIRSTGDYGWMNERDLYWGVPRSGISFNLPNEHFPRYGIPYTIDRGLVETRIGLKGPQGEELRREAIDVNIALWRLLEESHSRPLTLRDCSRLGVLADIFRVEDIRIIEALEKARAQEAILP